MARRKRVLSGMRPTGRLHIGHYFGALQNWIKLQDEYDCFYFIADWHALTSDYADASQVAQNSIDIGIDWLAAGLDPAKGTLFVQSEVPEHAELHLLLSMVTPLGWLERVPTYKEQLDQIKDKDLHTYGFLGYPLLQSADIVIYDADFVPVGEDQVPHVEMTREVVRRFNASFGMADWRRTRPNALAELGKQLKVDDVGASTGRARMEEALRQLALDHRLSLLANAGVPTMEVLQEPSVLLTETPRILGTDGRKMSKSYGNYISLSESDESIRTKTRAMVTDPARVRRADPGNPDLCPVFSWHKLFSPQATIDRVNRECRTAAIGCVECKGMAADSLVKWIEPIRARRQQYEAQPEKVWKILRDGSLRARKTARKTLKRAREAIFAWKDLRAKWTGGAAQGKTVVTGS